MFYRESGQLKSSYIGDQAMFPIAQDRWFVFGVLAKLRGPPRSCQDASMCSNSPTHAQHFA